MKRLLFLFAQARLRRSPIQNTYCCPGQHRYAIRQLLAPREQTNILCGLAFLPALVVHSSFRVSDVELHECARQCRNCLNIRAMDISIPAEMPAAECLNPEL